VEREERRGRVAGADVAAAAGDGCARGCAGGCARGCAGASADDAMGEAEVVHPLDEARCWIDASGCAWLRFHQMGPPLYLREGDDFFFTRFALIKPCCMIDRQELIPRRKYATPGVNSSG
jgi:hypothetical protein